MDERLHRFHAELEDTHWWLAAKNRVLASLIDRFAPARTDGRKPRLLDIGCGAGGLMRLLGDRFEALGVDSSPLARAAAGARGLTALDGELPDRFPDRVLAGRFDAVVMSEVLEHVERDRAAVEAAVRLLSPRGLLVCTVPAHPRLWSAHDVLNHHVRRYTRTAFAALFDGLPLGRLVLSPANAAAFPLMAAARLLDATRGAGRNPAQALRPPPRPINAALRAAFAAERHWLPYAPLPFGGSLVSVHRLVDAAPLPAPSVPTSADPGAATPPATPPSTPPATHPTTPHTARPDPAAPVGPSLARSGDPA